MATSHTDRDPVAPARPRFTVHRTTVRRVQELGSGFARITLGGEELRGYRVDGLAPKVKVFIPADAHAEPVVPTIGARGFVFPDDRPAPATRTYTVRAHRPAQAEIDIDFVLHSAGPAGRWATRARVGDQVVVSNCSGTAFPEHVRDVLLVGDPSAMPAIASIAEGLGSQVRVRALLYAATPADVVPMEPTLIGRGRWIVSRVGGSGDELAAQVEAELTREPADHVWVAGEAIALRPVRAMLRERRGYGRTAARVVGYWRRSATADQFDEAIRARMVRVLAAGDGPDEQTVEDLSLEA